jgi:hypothetical protein
MVHRDLDVEASGPVELTSLVRYHVVDAWSEV